MGFYNAVTGRITPGYRAALQANGLRAFFNDDASVQPGQLQEVMLHETAVAWMRVRLGMGRVPTSSLSQNEKLEKGGSGVRSSCLKMKFVGHARCHASRIREAG